jgi:putative ABC transport system permease protein
MSFFESTYEAIRALRTNGMRSFLTMLAIMLGVGAVICMIAIGAGARAQVAEKIRRLGTNILNVQSRLGSRARHSVTEDDSKAILHEVAGVQISAPIIWGATQVVAGNKNWQTTVWGTDLGYLLARDWPVTEGRMFSPDEIASGAQVAIIGQVIVRRLLGGNASIGDTIRVGRIPFTIIGALESKGEGGSGRNQDDLVVIPLSAARSRLLGVQREPDDASEIIRRADDGRYAAYTGDRPSRKGDARSSKGVLTYRHEVSRQALDTLVVKFAEPATSSEVSRGIEKLLRHRHRQTEGDPNKFMIYNPTDALKTQEATTRSFILLIIAIASISLLIGGISIMNTMLVSVAERTREIGLRMAVGARRRDIRNQFLVEAVALALIGGVLGVAIGSAAAFGIARYGAWPIIITPEVVLLACGFTGLVGVMFGLFPAYRASRLDPMIALRCE